VQHGTVTQTSRRLGQTITLLCENAVDTVTWSKDDGPLPDYCELDSKLTNDRCYTNFDKVKNRRLIIKNLTIEDAGRYKCQANKTESPPLEIDIKPLGDEFELPTSLVTSTQRKNWTTSTESARTPPIATDSTSTDSLPTQRGSTTVSIPVTGSSKISLRSCIVRIRIYDWVF
jgi:hypothetical protein